MECVNTVQNTISTINDLSFFANFLRSRKNQSAKFEVVAVFVLPKRINSSHHDYGAQKVKIRLNDPHFF